MNILKKLIVQVSPRHEEQDFFENAVNKKVNQVLWQEIDQLSAFTTSNNSNDEEPDDVSKECGANIKDANVKVRFHRDVKVQLIPTRAENDIHSNKLYWSYAEMYFFKCEANDEIEEISHLENVTRNEAKQLLYHPDSDYEYTAYEMECIKQNSNDINSCNKNNYEIICYKPRQEEYIPQILITDRKSSSFVDNKIYDINEMLANNDKSKNRRKKNKYSKLSIIRRGIYYLKRYIRRFIRSMEI